MKSFKIEYNKSYSFDLEKRFETTRSLRYHFEPAKEQKFNNWLLVVFSAMATSYKYVYNYMKTLQEIPVNKLFILDDFGDQGSYYIGKNRDFSIETAVVSLIQYISSKYQIYNRNIISVGSSKGGYAAMYFGIKYYFGNVIVGDPQSKLGHFLINQAGHLNVASYISGGADEADRYYLDELLFNILNQPTDISPAIKILVGNKDHHYVQHVIPLYNVLKDRGYKVILDVEDGVTHEDLKTSFPPYLVHHVKEILGLPSKYGSVTLPKIKNITINNIDNNIEVQCYAVGEDLRYAYYIYRNNEIIEKIYYKPNAKLIYPIKEPGKYMVRVYVRNSQQQYVAKNSEVIEI
jgi:hypothetical protein